MALSLHITSIISFLETHNSTLLIYLPALTMQHNSHISLVYVHMATLTSNVFKFPLSLGFFCKLWMIE